MDITKAATREARGECFHAIMRAVAAVMDGFIYTPKYDPESRSWLVEGELASGKVRANLSVTLHLGDHNEKTPYKATAGGIYPRTAKGEAYPNYGDTPRPTINFQLTRPPAQIAADITRRLLPEYATFFEKVANWVRTSDAAAASLEATRHQMEEAGFTFPNSPTEGFMQFAKGEKLEQARPYVHIFGGYVDLKLRNLAPERARAVLELLDLAPHPDYV